ncbi:MAG: T9SS type A sorting domain-containing protein [Chitinophagaceae bacterium]
MKSLVTPFILLALIPYSYSQSTMQATIKKGIDINTIDLYARSSANFSQRDDQITFSLAIPAAYAPAPSILTPGKTPNGTGPVLGLTGIRPNFLVNNIGTAEREVVVSTETINGVAHYVYVFLFSGTALNPRSWVAGQEQLLVTLSWGGCTSANCLASIKLVNLPNGGPNQLAYWYFQVSPLGDITNYPTPFYANPEALAPVNGGSPNGSLLSLIELATLRSLPARLLSFKGEARNCNADLSWQATQEANFAYYAIERGTGDGSFQEVGRVNALTSNSSVKSYSFTDDSSPAGSFLYRLRLVDRDGKYAYSTNTKISLNCRGKNYIIVYPSPSNGIVNVKLPPGYEQAKIRIMNSRGEEVLFNTGNNLTRIMNLKKLANGTYIVQVIHNGKMTESNKIILNQ